MRNGKSRRKGREGWEIERSGERKGGGEERMGKDMKGTPLVLGYIPLT